MNKASITIIPIPICHEQMNAAIQHLFLLLNFMFHYLYCHAISWSMLSIFCFIYNLLGFIIAISTTYYLRTSLSKLFFIFITNVTMHATMNVFFFWQVATMNVTILLKWVRFIKWVDLFKHILMFFIFIGQWSTLNQAQRSITYVRLKFLFRFIEKVCI
jgi:hypothetical protein